MIEQGYNPELAGRRTVSDHVDEDGVVTVTFVKGGVSATYRPGNASKRRYLRAMLVGILSREIETIAVGNPMVYTVYGRDEK